MIRPEDMIHPNMNNAIRKRISDAYINGLFDSCETSEQSTMMMESVLHIEIKLLVDCGFAHLRNIEEQESK